MQQPRISATVGRGATNQRADVQVVQRLLVAHGLGVGPIDGVCGPRTVQAIIAFQRLFLRHPDGVVHVGGQTWRQLTAVPAHLQPPAPLKASAPQPWAPKAGAVQPKLAGSPVTAPKHQPVVPKAPLPTVITDPVETLTKLVPKPDRTTLNVGLSAVTDVFMEKNFGNPRENYSQECQPVTNTALKKRMVTESIGPFRVTGLGPAVESLRAVFADIKVEQPNVFPHLSSEGMLCVRNQRGSNTLISNHAWGCAIDLRIKKVLDARGDNKVQHGLTLIAPIFKRHGWVWGAAFKIEDAMHFEAGKALASKWILPAETPVGAKVAPIKPVAPS